MSKVTHESTQRVRYSETDVMGYLHHSNYARYYENARWELMRSIGLPYKQIEDEGYMLPVIGMSFKFVKSAAYDELLTVKTTIKEIVGPRITFAYKMYNENKELINKAEVNLAFIDIKTRVACEPPKIFMDAVNSFL